MTYMATPQPFGHIIYSFGRPFLDHRYYTLSLTELCPGEEKIFKEILQFYTFYPQNTPPPQSLGCGRGSWNLQFLVFLPYRCYIPFRKDRPCSSWEEDVNARRSHHDERRRTPTHSNRSTDHSDSGDLKCTMFECTIHLFGSLEISPGNLGSVQCVDCIWYIVSG